MQAARILVIEDNVGDIELLRYALNQQQESYELEILKEGAEALQFVHEHRNGAREPHPCVILLDLHLPLYDGMAILRAIRETPPLEHIHVVVLSGLASPTQKVEIENLGALYRNKPSGLNELVELATEIIAICKSRSPAVSL